MTNFNLRRKTKRYYDELARIKRRIAMERIFDNISASDADHMLYLIEEAHKPYQQRVISIGDLANEWVTRWKRAQPKTKRDIATSLNASILRQAYHNPPSTPVDNALPEFTFEQAAKIIEERWPGVKVGEPERAWSRQPAIVELRKLRFAVQQSDTSRMQDGSAVYRATAPTMGSP